MPIVQATAPDWATSSPPTASTPDNSSSVPVQAVVPDWAQPQDTSTTTDTSDDTDRILDGFRHVESADGTQLIGPPVKTKYGIERALGPYQFLPSTAADVGLTNPFDEKAARAATKDYYLKHKEEFGSEDLAIAAHDAGPGTIRSLIKTYGPDKAFDHLSPDVKQYVASVKGYEPQTQAVQPTVPDWAQQQPTPDQGTPVQATVPAWAQPSQSNGGLSDYIKSHGLVDTTGTMGDRAQALWNEVKNEFTDSSKVLMGAGASMLGGIGSMAPLQQEAGPAEFATMGQEVPQSDFPEQTLAQTNQNMGALGQTLHDTMWSQFSPDTQKLMDKGAEGMDILGKIYNAPVNGASYVARKAGLNQTADFIDTYGMAAWQALMPLALEKAGAWGAKAIRKVVGERTVSPDLAGKGTPGKGGIVTDDDIEAAQNSPQPEQPADPNIQSKSPTAPVKSDVQPGMVQSALDAEHPVSSGEPLQRNLELETNQNPNQGEIFLGLKTPFGEENQGALGLNQPDQPFMKGPTAGDQQELPLQRPAEPGQGTLDLQPTVRPTSGQPGDLFEQFATKKTEPEPGASPPVVMASEADKTAEGVNRASDTNPTPVKPVKQAPKRLKGGKQAGSAPILDDAARAILDGLDKGLTLLSRSNFKVGDWVKTMNDTLAKITEVKNENGTPVYTVREDGGKTYDLPRGGINYKYRPSGQVVNPVGYEKTPSTLFDNVTAKPVVLPKNQRGSVSMEWANKLADNIREMMNPDVKEEPEKPSIGPPLSAEAVKGKVDLAYSLSRPHDFNDFQTHMEDAVQQAPGMDAHILDPENLKSLWDNYESGTITISPNEYVGMSEIARREGNAASPYSVMRQSIPKELRSDQDIGRVRETILSALHSGYLNFEKPAVQILKWAGDTGRHIYEVANRLNTKLMAYAKPFYALSRAGMREVSQAFADWDFQGKYHKELLDSGLQYPSIEMLKAKGMSDKGAAAYDSVAKGYQAAFKFIRDSKGNIVKQLPGYMPHMWKGFWSFKVMTDDLKGTYAIEKADSKGELERLQQKYIEQGFKTTRIEDPAHFSSYDMVMGLQDSIMNMMDDSKVTGLTRKLIQGRIDRVMEGTLYESLERHGVHGFIGEHGPLEEDWRNPFRAIKARRSNNEIFGLYKKYVGDVTRAWRNEQMVRSVLQPMSQDLSLGPLTNLRKAVVDTVAKGTGFSSRELNFADKAVRDVLIKAGINPELPTTLTLALNEYARKMTINSANIGFAAQHGLFHLFAVSNLLKVHTDLVNRGEAHGNLVSSLGKYFASQIPGTWRLSDAAAQAARDRFATDGLETHMYGYDTAAGKVSDLVWHGLLNLFVNYSRRVTFDTHYSYFREFMPDEQAYQASKMSTNRVMQSFNPIDRPGIFNEGNLARAAMPFQQIKAYSFGRVAGALESVADAVKSKNPANVLRALSIPISLYATYMLTSGLAGGTPLANDWNTVSKLLNDKFDTKLPTYENWLIQSHTPFGAVIGPLSYLLGRDVSSTFESPSITAPLGGFAGLERGVDFAELLFFEIAKFGFGYQNTLAEKKIFESNMPTQLRRVYDYFYAQQTSGELQDAHGRSMYKQTLAQMLGDAITGKLSYGEAETRAKISASRAKDAEDQNYVERQSQNLYDILMNRNPSIVLPSGNPDFITKLKEVSSAGRGFNPDSFIQYVQNKMAKEKQPYVRQYLTNIMNSKDIYQRQRMINNFKNVFGSQ